MKKTNFVLGLTVAFFCCLIAALFINAGNITANGESGNKMVEIYAIESTWNNRDYLGYKTTVLYVDDIQSGGNENYDFSDLLDKMTLNGKPLAGENIQFMPGAYVGTASGIVMIMNDLPEGAENLLKLPKGSVFTVGDNDPNIYELHSDVFLALSDGKWTLVTKNIYISGIIWNNDDYSGDPYGIGETGGKETGGKPNNGAVALFETSVDFGITYDTAVNRASDEYLIGTGLKVNGIPIKEIEGSAVGVFATYLYVYVPYMTPVAKLTIDCETLLGDSIFMATGENDNTVYCDLSESINFQYKGLPWTFTKPDYKVVSFAGLEWNNIDYSFELHSTGANGLIPTNGYCMLLNFSDSLDGSESGYVTRLNMLNEYATFKDSIKYNGESLIDIDGAYVDYVAGGNKLFVFVPKVSQTEEYPYPTLEFEEGTIFIKALLPELSLYLNPNTNEWTTAIYTVTFNSNGGSDVENQIVSAGGKAAAPAIPTKTATETSLYTFAYWYFEDDNTPFDFDNTVISSNITLNAKWNESVRKYLLRINYYKYGTEEEVASQYTANLEWNSGYNVTSPVVEGYNTDKPAVTGIINGDTVINVYYTLIVKYQLILDIENGRINVTTEEGYSPIGVNYQFWAKILVDTDGWEGSLARSQYIWQCIQGFSSSSSYIIEGDIRDWVHDSDAVNIIARIKEADGNVIELYSAFNLDDIIPVIHNVELDDVYLLEDTYNVSGNESLNIKVNSNSAAENYTITLAETDYSNDSGEFTIDVTALKTGLYNLTVKAESENSVDVRQYKLYLYRETDIVNMPVIDELRGYVDNDGKSYFTMKISYVDKDITEAEKNLIVAELKTNSDKLNEYSREIMGSSLEITYKTDFGGLYGIYFTEGIVYSDENGAISDRAILYHRFVRENAVARQVVSEENDDGIHMTGELITISPSQDTVIPGAADLLYAYYREDASGWVLIKNYSDYENRTLNWKPMKAGTYNIQLRVKDANSAVAGSYEAVTSVTYVIVDGMNMLQGELSLSVKDVGSTNVSVEAGKPYIICAEYTGSENVLYQFTLYNKNLGEIYLNTYSLSSEYIFFAAKPDDYIVTVRVINVNNFGFKDISKSLTIHSILNKD